MKALKAVGAIVLAIILGIAMLVMVVMRAGARR